jgi:hypothetical protein
MLNSCIFKFLNVFRINQNKCILCTPKRKCLELERTANSIYIFHNIKH